MSQHTPGPLVCWQTDGSLLIVNVPTRESVLVAVAERAADLLEQLSVDLRHAAAVDERHHPARSAVFENEANVCSTVFNDLRAAIAKATGAQS